MTKPHLPRSPPLNNPLAVDCGSWSFSNAYVPIAAVVGGKNLKVSGRNIQSRDRIWYIYLLLDIALNELSECPGVVMIDEISM
jgi:hypothetical protein